MASASAAHVIGVALRRVVRIVSSCGAADTRATPEPSRPCSLSNDRDAHAQRSEIDARNDAICAHALCQYMSQPRYASWLRAPAAATVEKLAAT